MIELLNQYGNHWAGYFGPALIQNTIFLGLVFLALHLLRKAPANVRYLLCLTGLIKLLLPPFIPAWFLASSASPVPPLSGVMLTMPAGTVPAGEAVTQSVHLSLNGLLFLLWVAGITLYVMSALVSSLRLRSALKDATPIEGTAWTKGRSGDHIQIYRSERIPIPLTFGVFPKRIYVPEAWDRWSDQCRRMVISHELAHIRRWDGLVQVLQILAGAVYFFNPLVWWLGRQMNQYREMVCDDAAVVGSKNGAMEYSRHLVEIAERIVRNPRALGSASALLRYRNGLLGRVRYQMKEATMHVVSRKRKRLVLIGLVAFILPLSWYCGGEAKQDLPSTSRAADLDKYSGMQKVEIVVTEAGRIEVDGKPTAIDDLGPRLDEVTKGNKKDAIVLIRSEDDVKMDVIREIQEALVEMDLRKIVYEKESVEFEGLTLILPSKDDQERLKDIPEEHIAVLEVRPLGEAFLDGESVGFWEIPDAIKDRLSQDPNLVVVIRSLGAGVFDDFALVLAQVKKGGATRIAIDISLSVE